MSRVPGFWREAAADLGIKVSPRSSTLGEGRISGEIGKFYVTVKFLDEGAFTPPRIVFFLRLPAGAHDNHRFVVKPRSSVNVFKARYIATRDPDFDQRFDLRAKGAAADFAVRFLNADRRRALLEASDAVPPLKLMCNPGRSRPYNAPLGGSFLMAMFFGMNRRNRDFIVHTVKSMLRVADSLA